MLGTAAADARLPRIDAATRTPAGPTAGGRRVLRVAGGPRRALDCRRRFDPRFGTGNMRHGAPHGSRTCPAQPPPGVIVHRGTWSGNMGHGPLHSPVRAR